MGSVKEETTGVIREWDIDRGKLGEFADKPEIVAAQILSLVCKRIEGVENPYKEIPFDSMVGEDFGTLLQNARHFHFEEARQAILDAIKEE